jgi:hypothetical protein
MDSRSRRVACALLAVAAWGTACGDKGPDVARREAPEGRGARAATVPAMLAASYNHNRAYLIEDGKVTWGYAMPDSCQDAWFLADGHVLIAGGNRVVEAVPADNRVVWEYRSPEGAETEIHGCQPLADGAVLIGEGGLNRLIEVGRSGAIRREVKLKLPGNAHRQMRIVRKTPRGTYVVACPAATAVFEFDAQGRTLRRIDPESTKAAGIPWRKAHGVEPLENGNLLISTSYGAHVFEIAPDDRIVWSLSPEDVPEIGMNYAAGCRRLPNGNTVCSAYTSTYPLFEVTPDKRVVWKHRDPAIGRITNVALR